jgi:hypothetical protein
LASRVDMLAGTRGHRYFVDRQLKCLHTIDHYLVIFKQLKQSNKN